MKIVLPEYENPIIKEAMSVCPDIDFIKADSLASACDILNRNEADALVAGIDITTRDVVLACKENLKMTEKYFSSCFVMKREEETIILADAGICKNPDAEILKSIVIETYKTAKVVLNESPKIAMLSFSTFGSGGNDPSIEKIQEVIKKIKNEHPEIEIDGEMQLDVAIDKTVAKKKAPNSEVAGNANALICPDLNVGNILYKSMERFGGFTAAGPIIQGFRPLISDLSRGSTKEDVVLVFRTLQKLHNNKIMLK